MSQFSITDGGRPRDVVDLDAELTVLDKIKCVMALNESKNYALAKRFAESALRQEPANIQALINYSAILTNSGETAKSKEVIGKCLSIDPRNAAVWTNLGSVYQQEMQFDLSDFCFGHAITANPPFLADIYTALGMNDFRRGQYPGAIANYEKALELSGGTSGRAMMSVGMIRMLVGDLEGGTLMFERRLDGMNIWPTPTSQVPKWDGMDLEALRGKRVLVNNDQGVGDIIFYSRLAQDFFTSLRSHGSKIHFFVPQSDLHDLAQYLYPGLFDGFWCAEDGCTPESDIQMALGSVPRAYALMGGLPQAAALSPKSSRRIDLADQIWFSFRGAPAHANDSCRSLKFDEALNLAARIEALLVASGGVRHVHIAQFDLTDNEKARVREAKLQLAELGPWIDTAESMRLHADLMLSVDTGMCHLAGALEIPTIVFIPVTTDWRWGLTRTDCPYYPSMRLVRQQRVGFWKKPLDEAVSLVINFVNTGVMCPEEIPF